MIDVITKQVLASAAISLVAGNAYADAIAISIVNLGPNAIYVGKDNTVTTNNGFAIAASGGKHTFVARGNHELWARAITADQVAGADTRVLIEKLAT